MMTPIFLATLGQRPEAITIAFDELNKRFHYRQLGIIHTHPQLSGISKAYQQITKVLERDYDENIDLRYHELTQSDGSPLIDITDSLNTDAYYTGMVRLLRDYRVQSQPIHLLVAGGRKTMSVYATLAATLLFGEHDLVWTVLTKSSSMKEGLFHIDSNEKDAVTLVEMPLTNFTLNPR